MIEPYGTIIKAVLRDFASLNLVIESDSEYQVTMSGETYSLTISTENGYQPSIAAHISNNGQKFEIGLSARILDEQQFDIDMKELSEIKEIYHLDTGKGNPSVRPSGVYLYVKVAVGQILEFTSKFGHKIRTDNKPFYDEYLSRERALMHGLGL
ncbi:hypothetical protein [Rhodanobacter ginsengiterrae]|uniref:hypothetical protein n=1 Tax=Rhodanobacter ginsengiterrae TaxID=2008451 RepID=UPI003CEA833D